MLFHQDSPLRYQNSRLQIIYLVSEESEVRKRLLCNRLAGRDFRGVAASGFAVAFILMKLRFPDLSTARDQFTHSPTCLQEQSLFGSLTDTGQQRKKFHEANALQLA